MEDTLILRKNLKKDNKKDPDSCQNTGSNIEFKNIAKQMKVSHCIIADFELYNEEFNQKKGKKKIKLSEQKPFVNRFQVCCSFNTTQNKYYEYFGEDTSGHF